MPPKTANEHGSSSKGHSRDSSNASTRHAHTPATPSQLRQAHVPSDRSSSPEETMHRRRSYYDDEQQQDATNPVSYNIDISAKGIQQGNDTLISAHSTQDSPETPPHNALVEADNIEPNVRSRLLDAASREEWMARPGIGRNYGSFAGSIHSDHSFGGVFPDTTHTGEGNAPDATHALLGDAFADSVSNSSDRKKMSTTRWLAERHGIKSQRMMYVRTPC